MSDGFLGRGSLLLVLSLAVAAAGGGCGNQGAQNSQFVSDGGEDATTDGSPGGDDASSDSSVGIFGHNDGSATSSGGGDSGPVGVLDVTPSAPQTIMVQLGQSTSAMPYTATVGGVPIKAAWTVQQGNLGSIGAGPSSSATFVANGSAGGVVTIVAGYNGKTVTRQILIQLNAGTQNGVNLTIPSEAAQVPMNATQLTAGGGIGGVGGEGLGPAYSNFPATMMSPAAMGLQILYPYNGTVFPRGLLAPLIQWAWTPGDADAVEMQLATTSSSFTWTGTFGRPTILSTVTAANGYNTNFIRCPIPQDIWAVATNTAGGLTLTGAPDQLTLTLVVAKGGVAYGPITETWTIAPATLAGTVYYNSYGTRLVENSNFRDFMNNQDGAAVLAITEGALAPTVIAGTASNCNCNGGNTADCQSGDCGGSGCRVCHTAAAGGSLLVAQHGDNYNETSWFNLNQGAAETVLNDQALFGWPGLSADGTLALTDSESLLAGTPAMQLYAFPGPSQASGMNATPITTNLPTDVQGGTPAFSPDGKHVAFWFMGGTINGVAGNLTQLVTMDFDGTSQFTNLSVLATMHDGNGAGFPSFFPTDDAVAFHYQIGNTSFSTWQGSQAQIWWSDLATGTATNLYALNGLDSDGTTPYLPVSPYLCPAVAAYGTPGGSVGCDNNAGGAGALKTPPVPAGLTDTTLNYEPTVNPISSGGYIWVVFTSRREYGNVANTNPWLTDPRDYDNTWEVNATTKKLWVAAIDVNASSTPGTDPSHPAFYLPAQELLAGNSRGYWVLTPCLADGKTCQTGDQCCNGYCEPNEDGGGLICANSTPNNSCSGLEEKCTTAADCCDTTNLCANGFCASGMPQ